MHYGAEQMGAHGRLVAVVELKRVGVLALGPELEGNVLEEERCCDDSECDAWSGMGN